VRFSANATSGGIAVRLRNEETSQKAAHFRDLARFRAEEGRAGHGDFTKQEPAALDGLAGGSDRYARRLFGIECPGNGVAVNAHLPEAFGPATKVRVAIHLVSDQQANSRKMAMGTPTRWAARTRFGIEPRSGFLARSRCAAETANLSLLRHHYAQNVVNPGRISGAELSYPFKHVGIQAHGHQLLRGAFELR
jgi:hypothetical protein